MQKVKIQEGSPDRSNPITESLSPTLHLVKAPQAGSHFNLAASSGSFDCLVKDMYELMIRLDTKNKQIIILAINHYFRGLFFPSNKVGQVTKLAAMPQAKLKPSEVAAEAKKTYFPHIKRIMPEYLGHSFLHPDSPSIQVAPELRSRERTRVAIIDGDPVDVAIDWYETLLRDEPDSTNVQAIPIVNMANEKRPGGDWESGLIAPEECLARRSTLMAALPSPWSQSNTMQAYHPLPQRAGIYSPSIVIFRDGHDNYEVWDSYKIVPVISVAPVKRPKVDKTGTSYSFDKEKELMMDKMRTVLRIAAAWRHHNICLGAFGVGPIFRNPVREVARMWRHLLFFEEEFKGVFANVVFAIDGQQGGNDKACQFDIDVFREEFDPSAIFRTSYR